MKKVTFIVEKNQDGYWAYSKDPDGLISGYGNTIAELKTDIVSGYRLFAEETGKVAITEDQVKLDLNLGAFFDLYKEVSAAGISRRSGINKTLLSEYITGSRKPSEKQKAKIASAIKDLGKELYEIELV